MQTLNRLRRGIRKAASRIHASRFGPAVVGSVVWVLALSAPMASAQLSTVLSDEFDDASSLSDWTPLPSNPITAGLEDVDSSEPGKLVMIPAVFNQNGWFGSSVGAFRYKLVEGDFVVASHIIAGNVNSPNDDTVPPTGTYNSAGFVVRDPASFQPDNENWLMYNHGAQVFSPSAGHSLATETKTTVESTSVLTLRPTMTPTSNAGQLALCRRGNLFHMFKWMDDEADWTLEATYSRPDLPQTLQVGAVVNGWTQASLRAQFEYVRIWNGPIPDLPDCLAAVPEPDFALSLAPGLLALAALQITGRRRQAQPWRRRTRAKAPIQSPPKTSGTRWAGVGCDEKYAG